MGFDSLGEDWVVWSDEGREGRTRLPPGRLRRRRVPRTPVSRRSTSPAASETGDPAVGASGADWYVTLALEPEVTRDADAYEDREGAVAGAVALAEAFAAGEVEYRDLYQVHAPITSTASTN